MDINNSTLLSILVQGKNLSTPSTNIDGFLVWLKLFFSKTDRTHKTIMDHGEWNKVKIIVEKTFLLMMYIHW